jgi:hypothetical protein
MIQQIWGGAIEVHLVMGRELLFDKLQELVPRTDAQRAIQSQSESECMGINPGCEGT